MALTNKSPAHQIAETRRAIETRLDHLNQLSAATFGTDQRGRRHQSVFNLDSALAAVRWHVQKNLHRKISLSEVAGVAGLERTYFSFYFHREVGVTFREWLQSLRVSRSIDLLRSTAMAVNEVALLSGYTEASTFIRTFRRQVGVTPTAFRRAVT